jgi:hypothetical protein
VHASTLQQMENNNMDRGAPVLIRIYKEERTLEVWKQDRTGKFTPLQSYPICKFPGKLGPKIAQGDYQAPEGFYDITPGQMNPQSSEYLSFNIGFPNAFDRSLGRHRQFSYGARRVPIGRLLRHDGLPNGRDLRPGRGGIQRRPGQSAAAGFSLPNDRGKFAAARGRPQCSVLGNAQDRQRRLLCSGRASKGCCLQSALRLQSVIWRQRFRSKRFKCFLPIRHRSGASHPCALMTETRSCLDRSWGLLPWERVPAHSVARRECKS